MDRDNLLTSSIIVHLFHILFPCLPFLIDNHLIKEQVHEFLKDVNYLTNRKENLKSNQNIASSASASSIDFQIPSVSIPTSSVPISDASSVSFINHKNGKTMNAE